MRKTIDNIILVSAALITLGTGLVYGCKKDYPIAPTQPTPIVTPAPTQEPTITSIPEPIPTISPTPTPIIVTPAPLETIIYETLIDRVPEIQQFDARIINATVAQIRDDIYSNKLDSDIVQIGDKAYNAWDYISKAIGFVLPRLKGTDLSKYSDMDLRQILMPAELRKIDIKRVIAERRINYDYNRVGLEIGLKNVTRDESLGGKSPQEWLREEIARDYNTKTSKSYEEAMYWSTGAAFGWSNSTAAFLEIRKDMLARGEIKPLFIIGWTIYKVGEQTTEFAPLVGRSMENPLATYFGRAIYPRIPADGRLGVHTEPWISYEGKLIGAWMVEEAFLKDYEKSTWPDFKGEIGKPDIYLLGPDSKAYNPYTLKLIPK